MVSDLESFRCTKLYVRPYGADARFQAAMQAGRLLDVGNVVGALAFRRIVAEIVQLQRAAPEERVQ